MPESVPVRDLAIRWDRRARALHRKNQDALKAWADENLSRARAEWRRATRAWCARLDNTPEPSPTEVQIWSSVAGIFHLWSVSHTRSIPQEVVSQVDAMIDDLLGMQEEQRRSNRNRKRR